VLLVKKVSLEPWPHRDVCSRFNKMRMLPSGGHVGALVLDTYELRVLISNILYFVFAGRKKHIPSTISFVSLKKPLKQHLEQSLPV